MDDPKISIGSVHTKVIFMDYRFQPIWTNKHLPNNPLHTSVDRVARFQKEKWHGYWMGPDSFHALTKLELLVRVALSAPKNAGGKNISVFRCSKGIGEKKDKKDGRAWHATRRTFKAPFDILSLWSLQVSCAQLKMIGLKQTGQQ